MGINKLLRFIAVIATLSFAGFASPTFSNVQENGGYRYELMVKNQKRQNILVVKTDAFTFKRITSAVVRYYKDTEDIPVDCVDEILLYVERAIKVNADGTKETISNSTVKISSPHYIQLTDFNAWFTSHGGHRGVFIDSLFLAPQNCPEKQ